MNLRDLLARRLALREESWHLPLASDMFLRLWGAYLGLRVQGLVGYLFNPKP